MEGACDENPWSLTKQVTGLVRSGALVVSFLLVVGWERRTWLKADMAAAAGFGMAFIVFPRQMLNFQLEGELTSVHLQLAQIGGLSILVSALFVYWTLDTRDGTVPVTIMMARIFMCGMLLMTMGFSHFWSTRGKKNIDWNDQHIWFSMLGVTLWMVGHVFHLLRSTDFTSYPQYNVRINTNLHLDAFLSFLLALASYAFPDYSVLSLYGSTMKMDALQLHLVRCSAATGLASAIIALQATGFLHEHDKRNFFLTRLVGIAMLFGLLLFQHLYFQESQCDAIKHTALAFLPVLSNVAFGYFVAGSTISYRAWTTNKHD